MVNHAGSAAVRLLADRTGMTTGLSQALARRGFTPRHDRADVAEVGYTAFAGTKDAIELEVDHRRHAVVEQAIAELKSAGLAHLPSGRFMANAAWLALAVIAHNLGRAVGALAGQGRATIAKLHDGCSPPQAGWCTPARRLHLRLPSRWPWPLHDPPHLTMERWCSAPSPPSSCRSSGACAAPPLQPFDAGPS